MSEKIIGVYDTEQELFKAIQEMKAEGMAVNGFSILAQTKQASSTVEERTGAEAREFDTGSGSGMDELVNNLAHLYDEDRQNINETITKKFKGMGMNEEEIQQYLDYVNEGKIILINNNSSGFSVESDANSGIGLSSFPGHK